MKSVANINDYFSQKIIKYQTHVKLGFDTKKGLTFARPFQQFDINKPRLRQNLPPIFRKQDVLDKLKYNLEQLLRRIKNSSFP